MRRRLHFLRRTKEEVLDTLFLERWDVMLAMIAEVDGREGLTARDKLHEIASFIFDSYRYGPVWYVIAFMLAFVSVTASLVVNLALAIFFARPTAAAGSSNPPEVS